MPGKGRYSELDKDILSRQLLFTMEKKAQGQTQYPEGPLVKIY